MKLEDKLKAFALRVNPNERAIKELTRFIAENGDRKTSSMPTFMTRILDSYLEKLYPQFEEAQKDFKESNNQTNKLRTKLSRLRRGIVDYHRLKHENLTEIQRIERLAKALSWEDLCTLRNGYQSIENTSSKIKSSIENVELYRDKGAYQNIWKQSLSRESLENEIQDTLIRYDDYCILYDGLSDSSVNQLQWIQSLHEKLKHVIDREFSTKQREEQQLQQLKPHTEILRKESEANLKTAA